MWLVLRILWTFNYDLGSGRLMSQTQPENGTTSFTYCQSGRLAGKVGAKGQETRFSYDTYGRLEYVGRYPGAAASSTVNVCQSLQMVSTWRLRRQTWRTS